MRMRATAVQKECDRRNKNGAGDSNCIFRAVYPLEFFYKSLFRYGKNVLYVARTLKDRMDVRKGLSGRF